MSNQAPLSPEKYIRTRARSLAIYECMVNTGWQDSGIASIFIARKHSNGNITYGSYLMDTWCLGLKDTSSRFNVAIEHWEEIKEQMDEQGEGFEPIHYNLAHNIIFGGIEFAADYEFKPHKDFSLTQFILEEDDERIPIEEVEFGLDGKAHLVVFNEDHKAKAALNYLKANFEKGEFTFAIEGDRNFENDEDETEFDSDDLTEDFFDNLDNTGPLEIAGAISEKLLPHKPKIELLYQQHFKTSPVYFSEVDFNELPFEISEEPEYNYGREINEMLDQLIEEDEEDLQYVNRLENASKKYPQVPEFLFMLADAYEDNDMIDEAIELVKKGMEIFPDRFYLLVKQIDLLSGIDRDKDCIALGREYYLKLKDFADRGLIYKNELSEFFMSLIGPLSSAQFIEDAQICLGWVQYLDTEQFVSGVPETSILLAKYAKLNEAGLMPLIF
jgi:hypothetical protein